VSVSELDSINGPVGRKDGIRPPETIKVHLLPVSTNVDVRAAIGRLVEEWSALTYSCLLDAAMAATAANEPMRSDATGTSSCDVA
jgi:hypothetical protein